MLYRIFASIWIALRMVQRNKLRAGLTVIGITIGIAAVVTMTALGKGARSSVSASVSSLGSNMLIVFPQSGRSSGAKSALGARLSELDGEALVRESTSIRLAAPFMRAGAQAVYEGQNTKTSVIGSRLTYFEVRNLKVVKGEKWTTASESVGEKVVLIGATTAHDLFGTGDPIGHTIRVGKYPYQVIGLLEEKGNSPFGEDQDQIVLMPITTLRTHVLASARPTDVHGIMLSATSEETTGRALKQATEILRQRHHIPEGDEDDFVVRTQAELQSLQQGIFGALSLLLVAIAGISLLVGGIGVMNIMLVSVTERTREIGIRMAIGAREADIMIQFLSEAIALALAGGLVGTAFGYAAILGLSAALGWSMTLDQGSLVVALVVSSVIGLVFGFFPARRAAKLDPVTALARE
ncbi:MAG: ABC transporter permease [Byssovorax sp.]